MSLARLPTETIVKILDFTDPSDVHCFQQVCRRFRNLVATNLYLQYVLELNMRGYVVPLVPRTDLSHAEKISALCDHRRRWQNTELAQPEFIKCKLPPNPRPAHPLCFVGGTLVCGQISSITCGTDESNHTIDFHQLPSFNKGTEYKFWRHEVSARAVRRVTIQPESDLLVLLGQISTQNDTMLGCHERFRLHLRTMGTNEPHPAVSPLARTGLDFDITSTTSTHSPRPFWRYKLQIYGRLVAVMLCDRIAGTHVIIWNWLLGSQVAHIHLSGPGIRSQNADSFCFVSEDYLIISRVPDESSCTDGRSNSKSLGCLMLYHLPPHSDEPKPSAHCVAEFFLPDYDPAANVRTRIQDGAPTLEMSPVYRQAQLEPLPKIFEMAPNHLLHISITASTAGLYHFDARSVLGALVVPTQALFDTLAETENTGRAQPDRVVRIPWKAWGHFTSWVNTNDANLGSYWCQRRSAVLQHLGHKTRNQTIRIWDFDPNRLLAQGAKRREQVWEIDPSRFTGSSQLYNERNFLDRIFLGGAPIPARQYETTDIILEGVPQGHIGAVMIGDEHVVIQSYRGDRDEGFLVYAL